MSDSSGASIHIGGIVQGVGFRPFVYNLATQMALKGWVRNTSAGVEIEVDGTRNVIQAFVEALKAQAPPLARIDEISVEEHPLNGFETFEIQPSQSISEAFQPISPDGCICVDCLREMFDPLDRRYRYPFINCTNCGPRFTIIKDIPYDRPNTTMATFAMCPDCAAEYYNPLDRRFHAQPVACPVCGPQVWLEMSTNLKVRSGEGQDAKGNAAILEAQRLLAEGKIVGIKGLGGFHLACDATNQAAVVELRRRKLRVDKPFALMMPDLPTIMAHCQVNPAEQELLEAHERPIVLLERKPASTVVPDVAPNQITLGVMLPYTPLHYLLFNPAPEEDSASRQVPTALVMTSGNISEEPIATDNEEARSRLADLADAFLMHNRNIHTRCDDSVVRVASPLTTDSQFTIPMRRSRGYAPYPVRLPWDMPPLFAAGAELKNTFCITRDRYAFLSHHIGDMENYETYRSFEESIDHYERLFRIHPEAIAYDLHPNYLATRYALERSEREGLPAFGVQHHHAHILACMAENGVNGDRPIIGVAFDGTGYGDDGNIWGGEFLLTDNGGPISRKGETSGYLRRFHLAYMPLPGGDSSTHRPSRIALAYLWQASLEWDGESPCVTDLCAEERTILRSQLEKNINTPLTSSMGRLFDAVSALVGVRQKVNYEAQAAMELEALANPDENHAYPFGIPSGAGEGIIDPLPMLNALVADIQTGKSKDILSARFHNGVAMMVLQTCQVMRGETGITEVALSGGVWQNMTLFEKTISLLQIEGFSVYFHQQVPTNDGGLALGQAVMAYHRMRS